jgi:hypothetical protein
VFRPDGVQRAKFGVILHLLRPVAYAARIAVHTDFWVATATISPIAIATNLLTVGPVVIRQKDLRRKPHEKGLS